MSKDKITLDVIRQHQNAQRMFKDTYSFKVKQNDILYYIESALRTAQAEQLIDQNKIEALNKAMSKRQTKIDSLINEIELVERVTEEDVIKNE